MNSYFECRRCGVKTGALEWVEVKLHDSSLKGRNLVFNIHTILFLNDSDSVAFPIAAFLLKIFCATFFCKAIFQFCDIRYSSNYQPSLKKKSLLDAFSMQITAILNP